MSKIKLNNLKLSSFTAKLSTEDAIKIKGGADATAANTYTGVGSCCDPETTESNVDTCGIGNCNVSPIDPRPIKPAPIGRN